MVEVKVLVQGYARKEENAEFASSAVVLIKAENKNILVDTGMDRASLLNALRKENLFVDDINYIVLTHNHLDHCLLAGIFEKAEILDRASIYFWDGKIERHKCFVPGTEVKIMETPGHEESHCSVLIDVPKYGRVVIAGDVFWWHDDEEQKIEEENLLAHEDAYADDKKKLKESRKKILEIADYIIPGHGKVFNV